MPKMSQKKGRFKGSVNFGAGEKIRIFVQNTPCNIQAIKNLKKQILYPTN